MPAPRGATRHAGERPPAGAVQQTRAAHAHGKAGRNAPEWVMADPDHLRAYNAGKAASTPARTPAAPAPTDPPAGLEDPAPSPTLTGGTDLEPAGGRPLLTLHGNGGSAGTGAGLVLGVLGYAVLINYLRGGTPQVKKWFGAKFVNKTGGNP